MSLDAAESRKFYYLAALVASVLVVWHIVIPYSLHNEVLQWDSIGHLGAAKFVRDYIFPWYEGWNPNFFAGAPQGLFYSPLFHWLVAALSFVMPIKIAFKGIVLGSVLVTPLAYYWLCLRYQLSISKSIVATILMIVILCAPLSLSTTNNSVGGTFSSTFNIGLVANAFALPLFFVYVALIHQLETRRDVIIAALVLATLILSHIVTAIAGILFGICTLGSSLWSRVNITKTFTHLALAACLSAFWTIPFLRYQSYSDSVKIALFLGPGSFILIIVGLAILISLLYRQQVASVESLAIYFCVTTVLVLVTNSTPVPFHFYRLVLFPLLFVPIFIVIPSSLVLCRVLAALALLTIHFGLTVKDSTTKVSLVDAVGPKSIELEAVTDIPELHRVLVLVDGEDEPSPHLLQHQVPEYLGVAGLKGLFVESSRSARFTLGLEKTLEQTSFVWGVPFLDFSILPKAAQKRILGHYLSDFGVDAIISPKDIEMVNYVSKKELFRYTTVQDHYIIPLGGRQRSVLKREDPIYLVVQDDCLILVRKDAGLTSFELFAKPSEALQDKIALEHGNSIYYLTREFDDLYRVSFRTNAGRPVQPKLNSLNYLSNLLAELDIAAPKRELVFEAMRALKEDLAQDYEHVALEGFATAQRLLPSTVDSVTKIDSELSTKLVPRKLSLYLYKLSGAQFVEPVRLRPTPVRTDWDSAISPLAFNTSITNILIDSQDEPGEPSADAKISNVDLSQERLGIIRFHVDASEPTPILVKESYFPKWHTYLNGHEVKTYRAFPNLMLIYAKGDVEMRYERRGALEYLSVSLSLIALMLCGMFFFPKRNIVGPKVVK